MEIWVVNLGEAFNLRRRRHVRIDVRHVRIEQRAKSFASVEPVSFHIEQRATAKGNHETHACIASTNCLPCIYFALSVMRRAGGNNETLGQETRNVTPLNTPVHGICIMSIWTHTHTLSPSLSPSLSLSLSLTHTHTHTGAKSASRRLKKRKKRLGSADSAARGLKEGQEANQIRFCVSKFLSTGGRKD